MFPIRVRPAALADLTDAWRWYESQREGLGDEFRACIDVAMAEIARAPLAWRTVYGSVRRIVRRFPYAVLFLAEADHVEVLAVFHSSRDPNEWRERLTR
jgi:plasmid stabilization system protein ParE